VLSLPVARGLDSERCGNAYREILDRNQIYVLRIGAVDGEAVDLTVVVTTWISWSKVVSVTAARWKADRAATESTGLALHAFETLAIVDHEVVPHVLSERD
jgi:hypothetical protein